MPTPIFRPVRSTKFPYFHSCTLMSKFNRVGTDIYQLSPQIRKAMGHTFQTKSKCLWSVGEKRATQQYNIVFLHIFWFRGISPWRW